MTTVITGASGQLGRRVAESLLTEHGVAPADLVLVTRSPDKLADLAAQGAQVRHGDFDDRASLDSAFVGADKVLIVSTDQVGARVPGHKAAVDAAVAAGARSIAYTSGINPSDSNPIGVMWEHRQTEDHIRATAPAWTILRNSIYTEMLLAGAEAALASGAHVTNEGDGRVAYISRDDCAAAAAAVLAADGHDGKIYDITGRVAQRGRRRGALQRARRAPGPGRSGRRRRLHGRARRARRPAAARGRGLRVVRHRYPPRLQRSGERHGRAADRPPAQAGARRDRRGYQGPRLRRGGGRGAGAVRTSPAPGPSPPAPSSARPPATCLRTARR